MHAERMKTIILLALVSAFSIQAAEIKPLSQEFFGVQLGVTALDLKAKCQAAGIPVDADAIEFKDADYPATAIRLAGSLNGNKSVREIYAYIFDNVVYQISVNFTDTSIENMNVICAALEKKYTAIPQNLSQSFEDTHGYSTTIDSVDVIIKADRDNGLGGREKISVDYCRADVYAKVSDEFKRRKAAKVSDGL